MKGHPVCPSEVVRGRVGQDNIPCAMLGCGRRVGLGRGYVARAMPAGPGGPPAASHASFVLYTPQPIFEMMFQRLEKDAVLYLVGRGCSHR